jgi:hypothetical protein
MMVRCTVERHAGVALLIQFPDHGKSLLLQSDNDQASFANACGICDGDSPLSQSYIDCEPTTIESCPDDYLDIAEDDKPAEVPCARENRVVPVIGSIYCGCPKCDPDDDYEPIDDSTVE